MNLLTVDELALRLKVPRSWVYGRTRLRGNDKNPIPCLQVGRHLRFDESAVMDWLRGKQDNHADAEA
jgi:excisionase family DNA binding protein